VTSYQSLGSRDLGKRLAFTQKAVLLFTAATLSTASENAPSAFVSNTRITHCLLRNTEDGLVFFTRNFNY
jgi:hypothetical protein